MPSSLGFIVFLQYPIITDFTDLANYHISDSGPGGIRTGHIDFVAQSRALASSGCCGALAIELVLSHLTPRTPPRSDVDHHALDLQIRHSAHVWQGFQNS